MLGIDRTTQKFWDRYSDSSSLLDSSSNFWNINRPNADQDQIRRLAWEHGWAPVLKSYYTKSSYLTSPQSLLLCTESPYLNSPQSLFLRIACSFELLRKFFEWLLIPLIKEARDHLLNGKRIVLLSQSDLYDKLHPKPNPQEESPSPTEPSLSSDWQVFSPSQLTRLRAATQISFDQIQKTARKWNPRKTSFSQATKIIQNSWRQIEADLDLIRFWESYIPQFIAEYPSNKTFVETSFRHIQEYATNPAEHTDYDTSPMQTTQNTKFPLIQGLQKDLSRSNYSLTFKRSSQEDTLLSSSSKPLPDFNQKLATILSSFSLFADIETEVKTQNLNKLLQTFFYQQHAAFHSIPLQALFSPQSINLGDPSITITLVTEEQLHSKQIHVSGYLEYHYTTTCDLAQQSLSKQEIGRMKFPVDIILPKENLEQATYTMPLEKIEFQWTDQALPILRSMVDRSPEIAQKLQSFE
ncbi:MAG: hypothetical protein JW769_05385 [Parachlamydiales bacterium]|nr:hypothetical protein [Parachlamydiales bacterium]